MQKSRTSVVLTNALKLRKIHEEAKASVSVDDLIAQAYWKAWDSNDPYVKVLLKHDQTKDGMSYAWICQFKEFALQETWQ